MANSASARKRIRANAKKHLRNKGVRSAVRTKVSRVRGGLVTGETQTVVEDLRAAVSALDRAAAKGILHRRNASRRKSRIATMAARLTKLSGEEHSGERAAASGGKKGRATKATGAPRPKPAAKKARTSKTATPRARNTARGGRSTKG